MSSKIIVIFFKFVTRYSNELNNIILILFNRSFKVGESGMWSEIIFSPKKWNAYVPLEGNSNWNFYISLDKNLTF